MKIALTGLAFALSVTAGTAQDVSKPRDWRTWLAQIVDDIETASRSGNQDLLSRRIRRPIEFLATASHLPEPFNVNLHCTLAAQSASNYSLSLRQGKAAAARADLRDYRRYDRDCGVAIAKFEQASPSVSIAAPTPVSGDSGRSPRDWLAKVKYDARSAAVAAQNGRVNIDVLRAVAKSALVYREQIAEWNPSPKRSQAYGICGDAVIALAKVGETPGVAIEDFQRLEGLCEAAIEGK